MTDIQKLLKDIFERAVKTAVYIFVLLMGASATVGEAGITDWSTLKRAGYALIGSGLSVIGSALSSLRGNRNSASATKDI